MTRQPKDPPSHLSEASKKWWRQVCEDYVLEPHHFKILQSVAESWDRIQAARRAIQREGLMVHDRFGQLKVNPAADLERKSRDSFRLLLRELALDVAPPSETRPPAAPANSDLKR